MSKVDIVVIGGGIAGLATAEMLSRNGNSVLLLEKEDKICSLSSGAHHGWFHFGSLYSIFPGNEFLSGFVRNIHVLLDYYSHLPGFNLKVGKNGKLDFINQERKWFTERNIDYIAASRNDNDFNLRTYSGFRNYLKKIFFTLLWEVSLKRFVGRHVNFHNNKWDKDFSSSMRNISKKWYRSYNKSLIKKHNYQEINLDPNTHFLIEGFDRAMNLEVILEDILNAFISNGGIVLPNSEVLSIKSLNQNYQIVTKDNKEIECEFVVNAAGKNIPLLSSFDVTNVESPLLVVYPKLLDKNFVRLTPFVDRTINHIVHSMGGKEYSLVGGGGYSNSDEKEKIQVLNELKRMSSIVFKNFDKSAIIESYFSTKTEFISNKGRNYLYKINQEGKNQYNIIPGKFTLAFSLSLELFKLINKKEPNLSKEMASNIHSPNENLDLISKSKAVSILSQILLKKNK